MILGNDQNIIDKIKSQSFIFSNTILALNIYVKTGVSNHKLSEEKEIDTFLNKIDKERISDKIRQRNREKNSSGKINRLYLRNDFIYRRKYVAEILTNLVHLNNETSNRKQSDSNIISLYKIMYNIKKGVIKVNRKETLR